MTIFKNPTLTPPNSLYEEDFYQWLIVTVKLLREGSFEQIELDNLIKELEESARKTQTTLKSNLRVLLMSLLQYKYQPPIRSESFEFTVRKYRLRLLEILAESPSLKSYFSEVFNPCYIYSRQLASNQANLPLEQFPEICPFTQEQILDIDYWPE